MKSLFVSTLVLGAALATSAQAQAWTSAYTSSTATGDCAGLPAALNTGFTIEPIISRTLFTNPQPARITKLAFWLNPTTQKADIFVGERGSTAASPNSDARILYYNASATPPTLTVIAEFNSLAYRGFSEAGLLGLAVNPMTFDQDNFLYVMYSFGSGSSASPTNGWRVSRFKTHPTTRVVDMASEKVLMHLPAGNSGRWHTATSLRFDNFGNLYIGLGDNEATARGPAATGDYRGGILRIKPDTTAALGYTVPAGNFGDYWAQKWQDSGLVSRANAYRDTSLVKPEIYIKGSRNPYSFGVDPYRLGWVAWSECGPDRQGERAEEHNFTTKPAFSGWPFWVGNGVRQSGYASSYDERPEPTSSAQWSAFNPASMTTQMPVNNWVDKVGFDTLPPMHVPYHSTTSGCAMGGPIVRYNGSINNPDKLPPHLDNVIISSNGTSWYAMKIDTATGTTTGTATSVFTMSKASGQPSLRNSSETVQGPDGVLYVVDQSEICCGTRGLNNTEGVAKLRYTGTCQDPGLVPVVSINPGRAVHRGQVSWLRVGKAEISLRDDGSGRIETGSHVIRILDVNGRIVHTIKGHGARTHAMPTLEAGKIFVLRVETPIGTAVRTFSTI